MEVEQATRPRATAPDTGVLSKARRSPARSSQSKRGGFLRTHPSIALIALLIIGVFSIIAGTAIGPINIPFADVVRTAIAGFSGARGNDLATTAPGASVVWEIRLPRVLVAALIGAALACAGATMQAVFRNPLADPGIIGVSAGSATATVIALVTGLAATGFWVLPTAAFIGALVTVIFVQLIATLRGGGPATLVLVGVAASAFLGAVTSAAVANAPEDSDVRSVMFWLNGDLVARTWQHVGIAVGPVLIGLVILFLFHRDLNLLLLGAETAEASGVNVARSRQILLAISALLTAAAVSVSGIIGFVGLIVPHLVRLVIGPDHRWLLPATALTGAIFVNAADVVARMLFNPIVLQTGSVVAFIGSPLFLWLLLRTRSGHQVGI